MTESDRSRKIFHGVSVGVTTIATCVIAWATIELANVSNGQRKILEQTDQTSRLRDRAFVYFFNPTIIPYPPERPTVWGIGINVENAGNMPARRVTLRYDCVDAPRSQHVLDPFPMAKWKNAEAPNVIGPKRHVSTQSCNIPVGTIEAAKRSEIDVFILMETKYLDGFVANRERVTQMTRVLRFDGYSHSLGFAGPHNCSDDDCPP
ncbi:MAG: hypothetical protein HY521_02650 [Proteobacteria bacterium]|nr:hypothetical protein [Pseudomonadota bacterium]